MNNDKMRSAHSVCSNACAAYAASTNALRSATVLLSVVPGFRNVASADEGKTCFEAQGKDAIEACTNLIKLRNQHGPDLPAIYVSRGVAYSREGNFDSAIKDYDQAINLDPTYADAYKNRGIDATRRVTSARLLTSVRQSASLPMRPSTMRCALIRLMKKAIRIARFRTTTKLSG